MVQSTREWVQHGSGGGNQNTDVKQIADALFPADESKMISLITKANLDPDIEADVAWITSRSAFNRKIDMAGLVSEDATVPLLFSTFKVANSYSIRGKAREQLVHVLAATGGGMRSRFRRMFNRGNNYDGGGGFSE